jgi:ethanolamine utilization protein EutN
MFIGKIKGNVVATRKLETVVGQKLAVVEPYGMRGDDAPTLSPTGRALVTIDPLGAGEGQFVLVTQGSSARLTEMTKKMPIDAVVIGIIDSITVNDGEVYHDKAGA